MKTQTTVFTENGYLNEGQALELIQYLTKFCKEHKPGELVQIYHQHNPQYHMHPLTKLALCRVEDAQPSKPFMSKVELRRKAAQQNLPVHTPWQDQEP